MEMYVVFDFNLGYDCVIGIFSSEEKAKKAIFEEWEVFSKEYPDNYDNFEEFLADREYEIQKKTLDKKYSYGV